MKHRVFLTIMVGALAVCAAFPVAAQQKKRTATTGQKGVINLADITIVGRVQKPVAAVDVARIRPKLALAELRQPFVDRIEDAAYKEPF